ncbi:hypothetical protein ACNS7O_07680 [Haloferacaceae archaeon DSL9]
MVRASHALLVVVDDARRTQLRDDLECHSTLRVTAVSGPGSALAALDTNPTVDCLVCTDDALEVGSGLFRDAVDDARPDLPWVLVTGEAAPVSPSRGSAHAVAQEGTHPLQLATAVQIVADGARVDESPRIARP